MITWKILYYNDITSPLKVLAKKLSGIFLKKFFRIRNGLNYKNFGWTGYFIKSRVMS